MKKKKKKNREEGKVAFHGERVGRTLSTRPGCVMRRTALNLDQRGTSRTSDWECSGVSGGSVRGKPL